MEGAGGVAVAAPPSLSTDLGDDNTAGGRMAASPTVSRSDASGCQPARSGRSVDSHSLQARRRRQVAIGAALHRLGSEQLSPSGGDANSGGGAAGRHRAKRPRNVALEKVWGWLEGGTLGFSAPTAAPAPAAAMAPPAAATPEASPAELCSRQGSAAEPLPQSAAVAASSALAAAPRGRLAEALPHDAQPSRPLKRKSSVMVPPASPTLPPPPNPGAPEVDLECMLAHSNLERSRVARLDDAALAQHDAALLGGLEGPQPSAAPLTHTPEAAPGAPNPAALSAGRWAPQTAAVAIPAPVAAARTQFGAADGAGFGGFSIGSTGLAPAPAHAPRFGSCTAQPGADAARGTGGVATGMAGGGVAASAPPKLSPAAAAAAAGQRRRRSLPQQQ